MARAGRLDPLEDLEKNGPRPVYAIDGEERLLVDETIRAIKDHALPPTARDFNLDTFSGRDATIPRILEAAQTLPAFTQSRVVVVEHAEKLDIEKSDALINYLKDPNPTTVMIFVADKFDARTKVYKAFSKAGATIRRSRPKPREMPDIVRRRAKSMGIRIDSVAVRVLADHVGADITAACQALELLSLYVASEPGRSIGTTDVEAVVSTTREESIFALVDSIGLQDRAAVLHGLHAMLSVSREHPLRVLAMIARHYRNLIKARGGSDSGASRGEIQAMVGIPPFFMDSLMRQARLQPMSALVAGLSAITDTDRQLKGGALDNVRAMERLVLRLMRSGALV